jgi:hypothetical protein
MNSHWTTQKLLPQLEVIFASYLTSCFTENMQSALDAVSTQTIDHLTEFNGTRVAFVGYCSLLDP